MTITVTLDTFKGNVLEFYYDIGNSRLKAAIPKNVFQEMRGRFGNMFYIDEYGAESTAVEIVGILKGARMISYPILSYLILSYLCCQTARARCPLYIKKKTTVV